MKESNFQTEFGKRNTTVGFFELKFCKGKSLPFSALAEHQEKALLAAAHEGLYYKISDFPVFANNKMRFNRPKPFDCFYIVAQPAFVVVMFWEIRKKKMAIEYSEIIEDYIRS